MFLDLGPNVRRSTSEVLVFPQIKQIGGVWATVTARREDEITHCSHEEDRCHEALLFNQSTVELRWEAIILPAMMHYLVIDLNEAR